MALTHTIRIVAVLLATAWLSGCGGSEGATTASGASSSSSNSSSSPTTASASGGILALAAASATPTAGANYIVIPVDRAGASSGEVTVAYATVNGTAVSGKDYQAASGKLTWQSGDTTAKTILISLGGATFTGTKQFTVGLSSPTGSATLGSPSTATISISGAATASGAAGPINTAAVMGQTGAARLLEQGTMGATLSTLKAAAAQSYDAWFAAQVAATPSLNAPKFNGGNDWSPSWWDNAISGNDQLRQRMAFALSEILVISQNGGPIWTQNVALSNYYDILVNNALGNFRTLLGEVALSPGMGQFLALVRNNKPDPSIGLHADQNFAREVMQLFTVGLYKLNPDGSVLIGNDGNPVPTYAQADVEALSNVLTGWSFKSVDGNTAENSW